jgi:hypothetical protein
MGRVGCRTCPPAPARSRPPLLCAAGACSHRHAGAAPTPPHPDRAVPAPSHQPIPAARRQAAGIAGVFRVQHSFAAPRRHVPHPYHRTAWAADEPARHRRERHDGLRVRPQGPRRRQRGPARFGSARPSRAGPRTRSPANLTAPSREPRLSPARVRRPVSRRGVEMLQSTCARGCGARLRIAMISRIGSFTPSAPQEHVSLLVGKENSGPACDMCIGACAAGPRLASRPPPLPSSNASRPAAPSSEFARSSPPSADPAAIPAGPAPLPPESPPPDTDR